MKKFLTLAILSSLAASPVMAETFTHEGVTYDYKITSAGDAKLITGKVVSTGEAFRLRVSGSKVSGRFGGSPVSFRVAGAETAVRSASPVMAAK